MTDRNTTRVQLEMPEKAFARLKRLKELTEAASYAEVMRNALIYYEAMLAGEPVNAGKMKETA